MDRGLVGRSSRESRGLAACFFSVAGAGNSNSMCSSSSISTYHSRNRISDIAIRISLAMRVNRPYGQLHSKCAVCSAKQFSSVAAVRVCVCNSLLLAIAIIAGIRLLLCVVNT